ncbi:DUF421 domain-containing protein [Propionibacterium freudenreichii]|uniref:DUF421 domain-containing protein n=1 Tax=Propionibacterium freudenreichii TaxID=1744 RepID=UPI0025517F6B|nr:hypothetical protein [Propionibacterium freudenreichii]
MTMVPYDFDFWALALKLALGFICLVLQINLSGKGMLAPNSAIDQLQNYVLGGIVGGMIYNSAITPIQFLIVLLLWTLIVLGAKFGSNHVRLVKHVIDGEPTEVLRDGRLDVAQLARLGSRPTTWRSSCATAAPPTWRRCVVPCLSRTAS